MAPEGGFADPTQTIAEMTSGAIDGGGDVSIDPNLFPAQGQPPTPDAVPVHQDPAEVVDPTLQVQAPEPTQQQPPVQPDPLAPPVQPAAQQQAQPADDDTVTLPDGSTLSLQRLRELSQLDQAFRGDPAVAQAVQEAVQQRRMFAPPPAPPVAPPVGQVPPGGYAPPPQFQPAPAAQPFQPAPQYQPQPQFQPPPPPQQFQLPADVDPEDPTVRWVMQQQAVQNQQYQAVMVGLQQQQAQAAQQQQQASIAALERARSDFAQRYPALNFDDVAAVETAAGARGLGRHYMAQYGEPYRASMEALETAAATMPEMRPKLFAAPPAGGNVVPIDAAAQQRKQNLNAIAGKGGTAPRTEPAPRKLSQSEKVEAMAAEIAAAQQAN